MDFIKELIIKYWVQFILGGMVAWLGVFYHKYIATQTGVQALLRAQIIQIYNNYIDKKYVPIYERENIEELYKQYKLLGGNGVITVLIEKLNKLPTKEIKHED